MTKEQKTDLVPRCFICGTELLWDSDSTAPTDDEETVSFYHCPTCGRSYEMYDCNEEEKKDYPNFYKNNN